MNLKNTFKGTNFSYPFCTTISKAGNFTKPLSHQNYISDKLNIICQGYGIEGPQAAKFINNILSNSLEYLLQRIVTKQQFQEVRGQYLYNLIESCFEQLATENIQGSCSFGAALFWNNKLTIIKNQEIECYISNTTKLSPINSHNIPFKLNKHKQNIQGYINRQNKYSLQLIQQHLLCINIDLNIQKYKFLLIGSSSIFNNFHQKEILQYLDKNNATLAEIGEMIIYQAKKRRRTINQEDMSLIITKIQS